MPELEPQKEKTLIATIMSILIVMAGMAGGILFISAPATMLLGESAYSIRSAFHGLFAGLLTVTMTIGLYQAFRLWIGAPLAIRELEVGSLLNSAVCFLTIVFGNWVYIPYRAAQGPKTHFLQTAPEIHQIFFEFKEFIALFTLPLAVAAAYLICCYGKRLESNKPLRDMTALLLVLAFFYFVMAFGLGAAITKLKSV